MKASTSRVCENYDKIEGNNSNHFKLRKLRKYNAKEDEKIETDENVAEGMENLLLSFKKIIRINTNELIEVQQKIEEIAPLIQKS
ncbi:hypothetical protein NPIL_395171 [Nephila pilipes]|uniref:Uncharacterized protein n=1 Tax=Nephila pilipes TaxID=299642 RepID=A0A8X6QW69_NEPPI|nr:hypothetical protein NPIL_395171 [Nephila pilipes]